MTLHFSTLEILRRHHRVEPYRSRAGRRDRLSNNFNNLVYLYLLSPNATCWRFLPSTTTTDVWDEVFVARSAEQVPGEEFCASSVPGTHYLGHQAAAGDSLGRVESLAAFLAVGRRHCQWRNNNGIPSALAREREMIIFIDILKRNDVINDVQVHVVENINLNCWKSTCQAESSQQRS